jgi:DNA-directed RNA polymerase specialized sigma subunit
MIHSLDAYKFLKIDKENYINYQCQYYSNRVISIEHEWTKKLNDTDVYGKKEHETKYYDIYKVKIHEITLREIMILQAIYLCKSTIEIENIVRK